jgi:hypothetical protein
MPLAKLISRINLNSFTYFIAAGRPFVNNLKIHGIFHGGNLKSEFE